MRNSFTPVLALAALLPLGTPAGAAPVMPGEPPDQPYFGTMPGLPSPLFRPGPGGTDPEGFPGLKPRLPSDRPGSASDGSADAPHAGRGGTGAAAEPPPKSPTRAETIDRLFDRLAKASDTGEAKGIVGLLEHYWMMSGSDTADLLMTRALAALKGERRDVASALLDQIVTLQPGWAEAWNRRATLRFLDGDDTGSMEDISHVLALEPRHFGALSGMGFILERHGDDKAALTALRRALAIDPADAELRKAVDKLAPVVDGQDL